MAIDEGRRTLGVEGEEVGGRAGPAGGVVFTRYDVLQETFHELAAVPGDIGTADAGGGESAAHGVDGVVVEFVEFLGGTVPVRGSVRFVPDLPIPRLDLGAAVAGDAVRDPLVNELGPLRVILRWVGPTAGDETVGEAGAPGVLVGLGEDREGLGHKADLGVGADAAGEVGVEDAVDDGPVVDGLAVGVFGVGVSAAPLEGGRTVAGVEEIMRAEKDVLGLQFAEGGEEFAAVLHRGVVGFVGAEETPDGAKRARGFRGIDGDGDGEGRGWRRRLGA